MPGILNKIIMVKLISATKLKMPEPTEHEIQCALFQVLEYYGEKIPEWQAIYAIPNGAKLPYGKTSRGKRYSKEANWLLKEGMKPGTPDICCPYSDGTFSALYIEMKRPGNYPSMIQSDKIKCLQAFGNKVEVYRSMQTALNEIIEYTIRRYENVRLHGKTLTLLKQIQQHTYKPLPWQKTD